MRERQWAQVTVSNQSNQYRGHAFCKRRPRLRTAVESKSVTTQGRSLLLAGKSERVIAVISIKFLLVISMLIQPEVTGIKDMITQGEFS